MLVYFNNDWEGFAVQNAIECRSFSPARRSPGYALVRDHAVPADLRGGRPRGRTSRFTATAAHEHHRAARQQRAVAASIGAARRGRALRQRLGTRRRQRPPARLTDHPKTAARRPDREPQGTRRRQRLAQAFSVTADRRRRAGDGRRDLEGAGLRALELHDRGAAAPARERRLEGRVDAAHHLPQALGGHPARHRAQTSRSARRSSIAPAGDPRRPARRGRRACSATRSRTSPRAPPPWRSCVGVEQRRADRADEGRGPQAVRRSR